MRGYSSWLAGGFRQHLLDSALPGPTAPAAPANPAPAVPGAPDLWGMGGLPPPSARADISLYSEPTPTRGIKKLPGRARSKFERLQEIQADATLVLRNIAEKQALAGERKRQSAARFEAAQITPGVVGRKFSPHEVATLPGRAQAIEWARQELTEATQEHDGLTERLDRVRVRLSPLPNTIARWLAGLPEDVILADHQTQAPVLKGGQIATEAVEAARLKIAELRADIHAAESAAVPSTAVKARMREQVAALVERGRPHVLSAVEIGRKIGWSTLAIQTQTIAGHVEFEDAFATWLWVDNGAALIARLDREIDELADDSHSLSDEQRTEQIAAILVAIEQTERIEEALIEAAEAAGNEIQRRPDASPACVLGVIVQ